MADTNTYSDVLTVADVAEAFNVSTTTVRAWDRDGKLSSFRTPGNQRRFRRSENPSIPSPSSVASASAGDGALSHSP